MDALSLNWKKVMYDPDASMDMAMRQTDWHALCKLASGLRDGMPCVPMDYATNGLNNMARLLQFTDGTMWVARIAMRRSAAATEKLRNEVDAMRWIHEQSRLPSPEIFAFEVDEHNITGVPFVLMSFIPGNTAMDSGGGYDTHHGVIAVAQRPHFYRSVALCHVQMTSLRLPQIGTIRKTANGTFEAGPIPGIGGPFDTATDFFLAWADHVQFPRQPSEIVDIMGGAPETEHVLHAVETFLDRFRAVVPQFVARSSRGRDTGPFPLCHPDFLHSNIIVAGDDDYTVLGVIDWEGACTLPVELIRFPRFLDAMPRRFGRPSHYGPDGLPRDEDERQLLRERREYVQMVAEWEAREGTDHTLSICLADENAQALSYVMEAFDGGKMGFYDDLLDDLDKDLPPTLVSL
ncbi:hypothetical protein SPBR_03758 [Sporothrix brasiliensis 5110]|uniref:Aminoglycoside phosphotransferase domain-containing protein n=1 Tax=Sporothrix brasiliensis 5110 TaxID=1398154 RepID=A0A0C2FV41_9PEZI|nr:uncharacterized protein SPBR_03758 [Sporothrix brasiliensis 5110]KIH94918.1 hypothetical protein SPBR_03758 [Sporothrix brasiliensis 5110]